jgi:hypothetical protein
LVLEAEIERLGAETDGFLQDVAIRRGLQ